ncbi:hypothetical protein [Haloferula sp.]|uniref:hypothetical protein n=1 Tax=Haloferula sp. TaxID=2497595 RepID=UPI003C744289
MKFLALPATAIVLLGSCAPKAVMVEEVEQPTAPAVAEKPEEEPSLDGLPNFKPNDGLLDPSGLSAMPTDRDMKPTVGPLDGSQSTVIANPPEAEKATSE